MNIYWIYDLPTWQLGLGITGIYIALSLLGLFAFRSWIYRTFDVHAEMNEMTGAVFSGVGVLYGLLLGLVAVATWENFDAVDEIVSKEAASVASLYRDISALRPPAKTMMQNHLRHYLEVVINEEWPDQKKGLVHVGGGQVLTDLHLELARYKTIAGTDESLYRETLTAFNRLAEARRVRLAEVSTGIPGVFWMVIIGGSLLNMPLMYLFHTTRRSTHITVTLIYGTFTGLMIFLTASVDNPLRGEVSVSSDAYESVLNNLFSLDPNLSGK
ncbi:MAG TPA: hypothetical protein DCY52_07070 [Methylococcaceae bacterium]|jgi:hypothetical protein|nr:hypothetical protein [Methylococcaceae bacterium]